MADEITRYRLPTVPTPLNEQDIANKAYVDAGGGGLPALTDDKFWLGNVGNIATEVSMSGDALLDNAGVLAIQLLKITNGMLAGSIATTKISGFDTQVRTSTLNQMATPTTDLPIGANKLTGVADPTLAQDAVTKAYGDANYSGGATITAQQLLKVGDSTATSTFTTITGLVVTLPNTGGKAMITWTLTISNTVASSENQFSIRDDGVEVYRVENGKSGAGVKQLITLSLIADCDGQDVDVQMRGVTGTITCYGTGVNRSIVGSYES